MVKKFKTKKEIAKALGICYKTFFGYFTGKHKVTNARMRKKIYELTGINSFARDKPNKKEAELLRNWINTVLKREAKRITLSPSSTSPNDVRRPFLDTAAELRRWFNNQSRWKTQKDFARYIGIPYSTLTKISTGILQPPGKYQRKIYDATGLPCFEPSSSISKSNQQLSKYSQSTSLNKQVSTKYQNEIKLLERAFYSFAKALGPFKYATLERREEVKKRIPVEDVGYVTSFIKAIYDEDKFSDFIFFTEYRKRGEQK